MTTRKALRDMNRVKLACLAARLLRDTRDYRACVVDPGTTLVIDPAPEWNGGRWRLESTDGVVATGEIDLVTHW